jgi:hypothetical protein
MIVVEKVEIIISGWFCALSKERSTVGRLASKSVEGFSL